MKALLRTSRLGVVLGVGFVFAVDLAAQSPRRNPQRVDPMTASIKGLVTTADTGAPVRGAEVRLSSRGSYNRLVTTDGEGLFNLRDLPAGEYRLTVSRTGFTPLVFGQRRPLEVPTAIQLDEGEAFTANLALTRGGAIHGRVIDQFGEPIAGTRVQVLRSRMIRGQRRLQSMGPGDQTDDTGEFRVYGLPPGDYYVTASTGTVDSVRRDPPIYYPATSNFSEAQTITLAAGTEASADFQLQPVRYARVSGIVFNASGAPEQAMVQLVSQVIGIGSTIENAGPPSAFMINADTGTDGRFTIENVPPGPYMLIANSSFTAGMAAGLEAGNPNAGPNRAMQEIMERGPETASMPIVVTGDNVSDLALTTRRGGILSGTFVADSGVVRALPQGLGAEVRPARDGGGMSMTQGGRGNAFRVIGMTGPFYLNITGVPEGWAVSQITVDGADVTDEAIDLKGQSATARVVLTDLVTTIRGVVQSRRERASYSVVVFPDDAARWAYPSRYVRATRADDRGSFSIVGLPANERYFAVAVDYLEEGEEQDTQFLERLRTQAMTFSLNEGERQSVVLDPITR
jgi:Carboxypeptidase regulatory-like domain